MLVFSFVVTSHDAILRTVGPDSSDLPEDRRHLPKSGVRLVTYRLLKLSYNRVDIGRVRLM